MSLSKQQTDKRFLLFESHIGQNTSIKKIPLLNVSEKRHWICSDRLVLIEGKDSNDFLNFEAFDLLMNEHRSICFRKTSKHPCHIYPLNDNFGVIVEEKRGIFCANFVEFNWDSSEVQLVGQFEKQCYHFRIFVDKMKPSKFVLRWYRFGLERFYQICTLVGGKIEFGEIHQLDILCDFYSNDSLIDVYFKQIKVYDLASKKEESFKIDLSLLLENVDGVSIYEWVNERLYSNIHFIGNEEQGIAWTDLTTKRWNLMNFESHLGIYDSKFFNGNLILKTKQTGSLYSKEVKFYSIPVRRPNFLRQSAWLFVVQVMKKNGEEDPYAAAKEFLPLNSDLRSPWFKDMKK